MPKRQQSRRSSKSNSTNLMLASLLRKNVKYLEGIPKSIMDIEKVYRITLPSSLNFLTLTTGGIASALSMDPASRIDTWSRWTAVFNQFIVVGFKIASRISTVSTTPVGQVWMKIDETSAVPTGTSVRSEHAAINLPSYQDPTSDGCVSIWQPLSAEDLTWQSTATGFTPAYLKTYSDPTNTGTSAADSTTRISHVVIYDIAFRYLQS